MVFDEVKYLNIMQSLFFMPSAIERETALKNFIDLEMRQFAVIMLTRIYQQNIPEQRELNPNYWLGIDAVNEKIENLIAELRKDIDSRH